MLDTILTDPPTIVHDGSYVVDYDEDQWKRYTEETQEFCRQTWTKKAQALRCERVALRLIPDPLFPSGEKDKPYFVWQHNLVAPVEKPKVPKKPVIFIPDDIFNDITAQTPAMFRFTDGRLLSKGLTNLTTNCFTLAPESQKE